MEAAAAHKEQLAYELRQQVALLPEGPDQVAGAITQALWEGRAADAAGDALATTARRVRLAADDLEHVAVELEVEADGLRLDAGFTRRRGDTLAAELDAEARGRRGLTTSQGRCRSTPAP